jgi:flagellar hook-length control protein FliK
MLQLPLMLMGKAGVDMPGTTPETAAGDGLQALLQRAELAGEGLTAEMQALLMQLSPPMLQRLEQLLIGGSDLPQAARLVLKEFADGAGEAGFPDIFKRLGAEKAQLTTTASVSAAEGLARPTTESPQLLPVTTASALALVEALSNPSSASATGSPLTALTAATGANVLPQQVTSPLLAMGIPQPVASKDWAEAVGQRLLWMVQGDQQFARLSLNPPNLGPLEVRVSLQQDQASVVFVAPHAATREALEAALPRLREMLDQNALQLVRADVSDPGTGRGGHSDGADGDDNAAWPGSVSGQDGSDDGAITAQSTPIRGGNRLVDLFA